MSMSKWKKAIIIVVIFAGFALAGSAAFWHYAGPSQTCSSCHEIRSAQDLWEASYHREVPCEECHGTAVSNGFHSLWENSRRLVGHWSAPESDQIALKEEQVAEIIARCRSCHEREYADWLASGHSMTYSDVFLNEKHNTTEQINADCLRCHGMFFEGGIQDIVEPISIKGPWKLVNPALASRHVIPCLTCHEIHLKGNPAARPDYSDPKAISYQRPLPVPRSGFFDRQEKTHFETSLLPVPVMYEGERQVIVSPDPRQRLCYQCHAPEANHATGTSDDRTPLGVHEGLSCFSCHELHSQEARKSCSECHPRLSNCGLDVEKMDTSYRARESVHNIHTVACKDCHVKGVPKKKQTATSRPVQTSSAP
jgi:hypothetical protein